MLNTSSVKTVLLESFAGADTYSDDYNVDIRHLLLAQNSEFIVSESSNIQVGTRFGHQQIAQLPNADGGSATSLASWYFSSSGVQNDYAVYYNPSLGVKAWNQGGSAFTTTLITQTGAAVASFAFDGARMYAAFTDSSGRLGFAGGQVYGLGVGADILFEPPLTTAQVTVTASATTAGVVTAGLHRIGFIFTTRNGYTGALNPVASGVFSPTSYTAADGVHNVNVTINIGSLPTYLTGGVSSVQVVMTTAANPARYFTVPGATATPSGGGFSISVSINDGDLAATGTDVTQSQNLLTVTPGGTTPPFLPSAMFQYSSRMAYCTIDQSGFPVVYFSDQNAYQSLTAAFHGIYLEGRQIPVQGASLGGSCYIATLSGLYATQDNGGQPVTWIPPARVDGSVGILSASCMSASSVTSTSTGRILIGSEKGLFVFKGGTFPQIPLSYWQTSDWNRINWAAPYQVKVVDDVYKQLIRVLAPLKSQIVGATNTNPIIITTATLQPHYLAGQQVTIAGVGGNAAANGTFTPTITGPNTFTIPIAGTGTYTSGGTVTPATANAEFNWNYSEGDAPGEAYYSVKSWASYQPGSIAIIRNTTTNIDESWYGPAASNPGNIVRSTNVTDTLQFRDVDMSNNPQAISLQMQTALVPGKLDQARTLRDFHGAHFRISGNGTFGITASSMDFQITTTPAASPVTLAPLPGKEVLVKWFLRNEQQTITITQNTTDSNLLLALIRAYYTDSIPIR